MITQKWVFEILRKGDLLGRQRGGGVCWGRGRRSPPLLHPLLGSDNISAFAFVLVGYNCFILSPFLPINLKNYFRSSSNMKRNEKSSFEISTFKTHSKYTLFLPIQTMWYKLEFAVPGLLAVNF